MATDAPTLLADAKCDLCNSPSEYSLLLEKVGLLKQILLAYDPMADTSAQAALAAAKCYHCYASSPFMLMLIELGLLKLWVDGGGAGAGINYNLEYATLAELPAAPPDTTQVWRVSFNDGNPDMRWSVLDQRWY